MWSVVSFHAVRFYCGRDLSPIVALREVGLTCRLFRRVVFVCLVLCCPVCAFVVSSLFNPTPLNKAFAHTHDFSFFNRIMIHEGAHWTTGAYSNLVMSKWIRVRK